MRGAGIVAYGGPIQRLDLPEPEIFDADQLLIAVHAAGVGNWDEIVRTGGWDVGGTPPLALGVEAAGVVRAVGAMVSRFRAGDEVLTHCVPLQRQGAWAEALLVLEGQAARKPAGMSFPLAGLFPIPALIAGQVLSGAWPSPRIWAGGSSPRRVQSALSGSVAVNAVRGAASSLLPLVLDGGRLATITATPRLPSGTSRSATRMSPRTGSCWTSLPRDSPGVDWRSRSPASTARPKRARCWPRWRPAGLRAAWYSILAVEHRPRATPRLGDLLGTCCRRDRGS